MHVPGQCRKRAGRQGDPRRACVGRGVERGDQNGVPVKERRARRNMHSRRQIVHLAAEEARGARRDVPAGMDVLERRGQRRRGGPAGERAAPKPRYPAGVGVGGSGRVRAAGGMGIARSALGARRAGAMGEESEERANSCMEPRPIGPSRVPSHLVRRGQAVACPHGLPVSRDCVNGPKRPPLPVARWDGRRPRTGATRA